MDITINNDNIIVKGTINFPYKHAKILAANPIDRMSNYSGSGLPFPSAYIAFENTINEYIIKVPSYTATIKYPNSYYLDNGIDKIPPTIYIIIDNKIYDSYILPDRLPLKTLITRQSTSREKFHGFKNNNLPIANQEIIMKSYINMKLTENIS